MTDAISQREKEFKEALKVSEREIMQSFAFKKEIKQNASAHSSLSETMSLTEDHAMISYLTEFEGADLENLKRKMRKIETEFSEEPAFQRDVQIVTDENYLNYWFFNIFETKELFSLTEAMFAWWPEGYMGGPTMIRGIMSVKVWGVWFAKLNKDFRPTQKVDFRCGMNKEMLHKGGLSEDKESQIFFRDNNKIEAELHFGCSLMVFEEVKTPMEEMVEFMTALATDLNDPKWTLHNSFFMSANIKTDLIFKKNNEMPANPLAKLLPFTEPSEESKKDYQKF